MLVSRRGAGDQRFRHALAQSLQVDGDAVWLLGSGRAALHTMVSALQLGPRDEVLLPGYTCVVVPNVFKDLGLPVRYVDIAEDAFNPSAAGWAAEIRPTTRVVVLSHNFGIAIDGVAALRRRFPHVIFIEDAAHAWGSQYPGGGYAGTAGHAAFFSFEYSKCLTTGLGGALLVNDAALRPAVASAMEQRHPPQAAMQARVALTLCYQLVAATAAAVVVSGIERLVRGPARKFRLIAKTPDAEIRGEAAPDYHCGLGAWQAWVGAAQARQAQALWARRRSQVAEYTRRLAGSRRFLLPDVDDSSILLRYPLRLRDPGDRPAVVAELAALGIEAGLWFDDVVHPRGSVRYGYRDGDCPRGEALAGSIINLPLGRHVSISELQWRRLREVARADRSESPWA
jgi:perosamine synthetase